MCVKASSASSMAAQARDASSTLSAKAQPTTAATTGVPRRTPSPNPDASLKPSTSAAATSQKRKASPKMPRADSNSSANSTGGKDNAGQPPPAKRMRRTGGKKADVPFEEVLVGILHLFLEFFLGGGILLLVVFISVCLWGGDIVSACVYVCMCARVVFLAYFVVGTSPSPITVNIQIFGSYLISAISGTDPKRLN